MVKENGNDRIYLVLCKVYLDNEQVGRFAYTKALSITDARPEWCRISGEIKKRLEIGKKDQCKYCQVCVRVASRVSTFCKLEEYPDLNLIMCDSFSCAYCENLDKVRNDKTWFIEYKRIEEKMFEAVVSANLELIRVKKSEIGHVRIGKKKKTLIYSAYDGYDLEFIEAEKDSEAIRYINGPHSLIGTKIVLRRIYEDGSDDIIQIKNLPRPRVDNLQKPRSIFKIIINGTEFNINAQKLSDAILRVNEARNISPRFITRLFRKNENGDYEEIMVA